MIKRKKHIAIPGMDDLFWEDQNWEDEWKDMPEFKLKNLKSKRQIVIHFRNDEDVDKFAELIDQNITPNIKYIWFPTIVKRVLKNKIYIDEKD